MTRPAKRRAAPCWPVVRSLCGVTVLVLVVCRLGTGPFLDGLRSIDGEVLALAVGIGALTTVASAWRWRLVAAGLGLGLPLRGAIAAYYRSQFLNTTLPGGVLGDVHRGLQHGRHVDDVSRGLRAVGWERIAGQVVFVVPALAVLVLLPSPVHGGVPLAVLVLAGVVLAGVVGLAASARRRIRNQGRWGRLTRTMSDDIRRGLLAGSVWPKVLLASVVVVLGHLVIFYAAVRSTGTTASAIHLLPIAVLVLLAMVVPLNVGGWGPREGMAAWAFGAAGFGASQGVAAATVYGVMALVATLPGAVVLAAGVIDRRMRPRDPAPSSEPVPAGGPDICPPVLGAPGAPSEKDAVRG